MNNMNNQTAIDNLNTLRQILSQQATQLNEQVGYIDVAIKLLTDGYQSDQDAIATQVETKTADLTDTLQGLQPVSEIPMGIKMNETLK